MEDGIGENVMVHLFPERDRVRITHTFLLTEFEVSPQWGGVL